MAARSVLADIATPAELELLRSAAKLPKRHVAGENMVAAARISQCHDGDSVYACFVDRKRVAGEQLVNVPVRLHGVDTPEISAKKGTKERALAERAKARVVELAEGQIVRLETSTADKYGRLLARIVLPDGRDLSSILIAERLAVTYDGGTKTQDWERFE